MPFYTKCDLAVRRPCLRYRSGTRCDQNLEFSFFVSFSLPNCVKVMSRQLYLVEETGEKQITGFTHLCPSRDSNPGSGEGQLAVSSNALERAIRAGHVKSGLGFVVKDAGANHRYTLTNN